MNFINDLRMLQDLINIGETLLLRACLVERFIDSAELRGTSAIWDYRGGM